jgi:hypothetical protein
MNQAGLTVFDILTYVAPGGVVLGVARYCGIADRFVGRLSDAEKAVLYLLVAYCIGHVVLPLPYFVRPITRVAWRAVMKRRSDDFFRNSKAALQPLLEKTFGFVPGSFTESYSLCMRYCTEFCPNSTVAIDRAIIAMGFCRNMVGALLLSAAIAVFYAHEYVLAVVLVMAMIVFLVRFLRFEYQQYQTVFQTTLVALTIATRGMKQDTERDELSRAEGTGDS